MRWLGQKQEWAGLKSIGCVRRTVEKLNGERVIETRYSIASIREEKVFTKSVRGHWEVENKLHWQLDFTFKDDGKARDAEPAEDETGGIGDTVPGTDVL